MANWARIQRALNQPLEQEWVISPKPNTIQVGVKGTTSSYVVTIDYYPRCTCPDFMTRSNRCKHIYFVLLKTCMSGIRDPVISEKRLTTGTRIELIKRANSFNEKQTEDKNVEMKTNEECPVCMEHIEDVEVTYCKKGCGNRFHANCIKAWIRVMIKQDSRPSCPMCRSFWKE